MDTQRIDEILAVFSKMIGLCGLLAGIAAMIWWPEQAVPVSVIGGALYVGGAVRTSATAVTWAMINEIDRMTQVQRDPQT